MNANPQVCEEQKKRRMETFSRAGLRNRMTIRLSRKPKMDKYLLSAPSLHDDMYRIFRIHCPIRAENRERIDKGWDRKRIGNG